MSRSAQENHVSNFHPIGMKVGRLITQILFCLRIGWNIQICTEKSCVDLPPLGLVQGVFYYKLNEMYRSAQKSCFQHQPHKVGWRGCSKVPKEYFAKNCMKYPDLDRDIMFLIPNPSWRGQMGAQRVNLKKRCFARNWMKYPNLHRGHVCQP